MKRLFAVLVSVLVPMVLLGQVRIFTAAPTLNSTAIDSIIITPASKTIKALNADFDTVLVVGSQILSSSFPTGTKVVSQSGDTVIVLDQFPTSTTLDSLGTVYVSGRVVLAYSINDVYGFPIKIPEFSEIYGLWVADTSNVQDSIDVYIFDGPPAVMADNATFAPTDATTAKMIAYIPLRNVLDFTLNNFIYSTDLFPPVSLRAQSASNLYLQLVAKGAATHPTAGGLLVKVVGR
jgi:hypothetical protein